MAKRKRKKTTAEVRRRRKQAANPLGQLILSGKFVAQMSDSDIEEIKMRIVNELMCIAFLDPADFFDIDAEGNATIKPIDKMPEYARRALSDVDIKTLLTAKKFKSGTLQKIKVHNKLDALGKLSDVFGLNAPKKIQAVAPENPNKPRVPALTVNERITDMFGSKGNLIPIEGQAKEVDIFD